MSNKLFKKTLIIGLGLIGGSFAKVLNQNKISDKIYAFDQDTESLEKAIKLELIHDFIELKDDLSSFDFIVLATPLSAYKKILSEVSQKISSQTIIIDLGSLKEFIGKILPKNLSKNFVACHPIAGSEKTGFANSSAELFENKKFIICPENSDEAALKKVTEVIKKISTNVEFLEAKKHDEIYALVSHLPQFISFLTKDFSPKKITDDFFKNAFRLDNSDAEIWSDIFKLNEKNLEKFYLEFFANLEENIKSLENGPRNKCGVTTWGCGVTTWERGIAIEGKFTTKLTTNDLAFATINSALAVCQPALVTRSISEKFFEENFAAIFFRTLVVKSYLEISEIRNFQNYAGTGFKDFTSIIAVLNYEAQTLQKLIAKNRSQILKLFNSIS